MREAEVIRLFLIKIYICMMTSKGLLVVYRPYTINTGSTAGVWVVIL